MAEPAIHTPGDEPRAPSRYDPDAALRAGQSGRAHRVPKPRAEIAPSPVEGDPERSSEAAINQSREMGYDEAMALLDAGKLQRSVLTERGWVAAPNKLPPTIART